MKKDVSVLLRCAAVCFSNSINKNIRYKFLSQFKRKHNTYLEDFIKKLSMFSVFAQK